MNWKGYLKIAVIVVLFILIAKWLTSRVEIPVVSQAVAAV